MALTEPAAPAPFTALLSLTLRTAAAMFTVSYAGAVAMAILGGVLWDLIGRPELAFAPILFCCALLITLTLAARRAGELR